MLRGTPLESDVGPSDVTAPVTRIPVPETDAGHRVTVPDTELLFSAKYTRAGSDLILTGDNGHKIVLSGYFDHARHADLVAPGGAILTADVVAKLTLSQTPGQYAQTGAPAGAAVIGKVERLGGSATVQHANGTVEELHVGDNVYQGDVIQTQDGSQLGMSLIDGTAFNMGASARMVLSELIYDSNSNSNSGVFSLVKGSISFVAGKAAKTGDMRVETPVATMGIRGTSVNTNIDTDIGGNTVSVTYSLMSDPDGHIGSFNILDRVTGAIIGTITTTDTTFVVTPTANLGVLATQLNKTPEQIAQELAVAQVLFPIFLNNPTNFNNQNVNPQDQRHGSGTLQGGSEQGSNSPSGITKIGPDGATVTNQGGGSGNGTGGNFHVDIHVNTAPAVFADTPAHLDEAVSLGAAGVDTALSHITKIDLDGVVSYNTFAMAHDGWISVGNGVYSKLGAYGAASLNTAGVAVAILVAAGWTDLGNGFLEKSVSFGAGGYATVRISSGADTLTYALDNTKADPLRQIDHPTETFVIPVIDDNNAPAATTVVFTVDGENDPPQVIQGPATTATGGVTEDADPGLLTASGTITFKDAELTDIHTSTGTIPTSVTVTDSNGHPKPLPGFNAGDYLGTLSLTMVENPNDASNIGTVQWNFSVNDNDPHVQALALGQVITQVYTITIDDGHGGSVQQQITVTITGSNDDPDNSAPVIVAGSIVTGAVGELDDPQPSTGLPDTDSATGTIKFLDVDLVDTHTATASFASALWTKNGGASESISDPGGFALAAVDENPADTDEQGSVDWTYSAVDANLDFLAYGEKLVVTYNVTITDSSGSQVTQPVTVTITGTNDTPIVTASDLTGAAKELIVPTGNLTDTGTIAFADVDLTDAHTIQHPIVASAGALGTLTASVTTDTTGTGTGGVITWHYSVATAAVEYLAKDETRLETFTFTLDDGKGGTVARTVSVTITGTNDDAAIAVVANNNNSDSDTGAVTEDASGPSEAATGTLSFSDVDLADHHTVSVIPGNGAFGTLVATVAHDTTGAGTGGVIVWNYSIPDSAIQYLAAGQTRNETFTIALDDGTSTVTKDVTVTITGANDDASIVVAPNSNDSATGAVIEDATGPNETASGTLSFSDVDLTDQHSVTGVTKSAGALGTLTAHVAADTSQGSGGVIAWSYTVADDDIHYLPQGQTRTETFTISLSDGTGTVTKDVTVTIIGTNDAPVANGDTIATDEDHALSGSVLANDTDADLGSVLSVSEVNGQSANVGQQITLASGAHLKLNADGSYIYDPASSAAFNALAQGQTASESFTYVTKDEHGAQSAPATVNITVTGVNDAPVFTGSSAGMAYIEGGPAVSLATGVSASDVDSVNYNYGSLTVAITSGLNTGDALTIASGSITVSGTDVMFDADGLGAGAPVIIGQLSNNSVTSLTIDLNDNATDAAVVALTQAVQFSTTASGSESDARTLTFTLVDGGGSGNGSQDTTSFSTTVGVRAATFVVGQGNYATIQAAIDAAHDGDTILIAAGTYNENLTISGKSLTLAGVDDGSGHAPVLHGQITADGTLDGLLAIENLAIDATGHQYGLFVSANSTGYAGSIALDHTTISGAQTNGFAYIRAGNGSTPTRTDTVGAISIINSEFFGNATTNTGGGGRGDVLLFGYNKDLTVSNVSIHDQGSAAQKAIQVRGLQDSNDTAGVGPYDPAGNVTLSGLTVTGTYQQDLLAFYNIASFHSFTTSGVNIAAAAPWGLINFDGVGGTIDLSSGFIGTNASGGPVAVEQGLSSGDSFTGAAGNDVFVGRGGADTISGGDGNDVYYVSHNATIHELPGQGIDEVRSTDTIVLADNVENATLLDGASNTQTFDNMPLGAIANGARGWKVVGPTVDQAVIDDGTGNHVFHISSDPSNGTFGGPYSPGLGVAAGEAAAGAAYQHQSISFDFDAVNPAGDNSRVEVDFANAAGTDRNNFMVIESVAGHGIRIAVSEPTADGHFTGENNGTFPTDWRELVSNVDPSIQHHLELRLDYVDGPGNDVISVYLDGVQIGTTTTFENYHDADPDGLYGYADHTAAAKDYMTDRILFRVGNNGQPQDGAGGQNQGFNFDNVTSTVYNNANVTGNALDNVITGNSGDNILTGGAGADTFVFAGHFGHDTITDFVAGTDTISIDHTIFADAAAVIAAATQHGNDTVITAANGDTITLQNVNVLHQNDFHLV